MPIGSVEGLLVTLLFVVPGGLGIEFRRSLYPTPIRTAFQEALHALAASSAALIVLELLAGLSGLIGLTRARMGDALLRPLIEGKGLPTKAGWGGYLAFLVLALALPTIASRLRRAKLVRRVLGAIAIYPSGFDHLFLEMWRPLAGRQAPWVTLETTDGRSLQGQAVWRSSAPHPVELVLAEVQDVTDPENPREGGGLLWIRGDTIKRFWLSPPDGEMSP